MQREIDQLLLIIEICLQPRATPSIAFLDFAKKQIRFDALRDSSHGRHDLLERHIR